MFPIEDSPRMFYILVPFMQEVQERIIRPIVEDEAFAQMASGTVSEELQEQFAAAKRCIPLYAVITAVKRMSVKVLPTMIVRRFTASFDGGCGGDMDDATTRRLLQTLKQKAVAAKTERQKAATNRRNPAEDIRLVPDNDPRKKILHDMNRLEIPESGIAVDVPASFSEMTRPQLLYTMRHLHAMQQERISQAEFNLRVL